MTLRAIFSRFYSDLLDWAIDCAIEAISAGALRYVPVLLFLIAVSAIVFWRFHD
jgi:hypothetical protein